MSRRIKVTAGFFSILTIVALVAFFSFYLGTAHIEDAVAEETQPLHLMQPDDVVIGDADAPITVVEYSSLSCPHCAAFHTKVYPEFKEKYIETGKVKYTNRQMSLNEPALKAGMLVHCVGPERTEKFTKVLFELQDSWAFDNGFLESLKQIAKVGGFSEEEFDACMGNKEVEEAVLKSRKIGMEKLNVTSTPTFFINGRELKGTLDIGVFDRAIAEAEKTANKPE